MSTLRLLPPVHLELPSVQRAIGVVVTAGPSLRTITVRSFIGGKFSDHKGVKRPLEEATAEGDKITAAATDAVTTKEERCSAKRLTARWPAPWLLDCW